MIYAKGSRLDVAREAWTGIAAAPTTNGSHGTMYAWQSNVKRLARYGGDIQRWQEYDPQQTAGPSTKTGSATAALVEYHAMHGCSILSGATHPETRPR